jgi:nicotinamidase-related amidase
MDLPKSLNAILAAKPHSLMIDPHSWALLFIDWQCEILESVFGGAARGNDHCSFGNAIEHAKDILVSARNACFKIAHAGKVAQEQPGYGLIRGLEPLPTEYVIDKPGKDLFQDLEFDTTLRLNKIGGLIVLGLSKENCSVPVSAAASYGYNVLIVGDVTVSGSPIQKDEILNDTADQERIYHIAESRELIQAFEKIAKALSE